MKGLDIRVDPGTEGFSVVAYHPDSRRYDKSVGHVIVECYCTDDRRMECYVAEAEVHDDWQCQGIGAAMYRRANREALKYGSVLHSGDKPSLAASMLWLSLIGKGLAERTRGSHISPFRFK